MSEIRKSVKLTCQTLINKYTVWLICIKNKIFEKQMREFIISQCNILPQSNSHHVHYISVKLYNLTYYTAETPFYLLLNKPAIQVIERPILNKI